MNDTMGGEGKVDVLGTLDACIGELRYQRMYAEVQALVDVRTAVAELIEAATAMAGVQVNRANKHRNDLGSIKKDRLRSALARIGGNP